MSDQLPLFYTNEFQQTVPAFGLSYAPILQQVPKKRSATSTAETTETNQAHFSEPFYMPFLQVRPNYSLVYYKQVNPSYRPKSPLLNRFKTGSNNQRYTGQLNAKSISKMRKAIELLVAISKEQVTEDLREMRTTGHRITFVTLTLASGQENISDKTLKRELLNHFLISAKRKWGLNHYVWKAERQQNGNLHFHITTDIYIPYRELRTEWNRIQEKLGFVSSYSNKHQAMSYEEFKKSVQAKNKVSDRTVRRRWKNGNSVGWVNPNSTDIHAVNSIHNLASYMCKYMLKQGKKGEFIDGKVWGCSKSLNSKLKCEWLVDGEIEREIQRIKDHSPFDYHSNERFSIIGRNENTSDLHELLSVKLRWSAYLKVVRATENIHNANTVKAYDTIQSQRIKPANIKTTEEIDQIRKFYFDRDGGNGAGLDYFKYSKSGGNVNYERVENTS